MRLFAPAMLKCDFANKVLIVVIADNGVNFCCHLSPSPTFVAIIAFGSQEQFIINHILLSGRVTI